MNASLNEKLRTVKWGEFKLGDLFDVISSKKIFHANNVEIFPEQTQGSYPYVVRATTNNGQKGYIKAKSDEINPGNTLSFAQDTFTVFYQKNKFVTGNKIKVLRPKFNFFDFSIANFIVSSINHSICNLSWGTGSDVAMIKDIKFQLPTVNGSVDFDFMKSFIAELEAERVAKLSAYLTVSGLDNYELSGEEENALKNYKSLKWDAYNLEKLFGKSTRGKRLKGDDRIAGTLPFVTAGEAAEGISAYISNQVDVFEKNTTTIDMFGSAKYRNYRYGADDHVAVVHTEDVPTKAAVFLTSAIHKAAHTGKFDYGHNFYAKDADALDIMLPAKENGKPDYSAMALLISAIQKQVVKDVVHYTDKRVETTKKVSLK